MSTKAHIRSRRKRRHSTGSWVLRTGVAGGILSTLSVAGTVAPANASEAATQTVEMPALGTSLATAAAESSAATQQAALDYAQASELRERQDRAAEAARKAARKAKREAERRAEAARKAKAAREARARAARSAERTALRTTSAATGRVESLLGFLRAQVGKAYVMGATGPSAYDCSGLTQTAFRQIGIDLPRVSSAQATSGTQVSLSNVQPGDILYWGSASSAYHVAVYVGGGKFIGAQNSSTGVVERDMSWDPPTGAVRVL